MEDTHKTHTPDSSLGSSAFQTSYISTIQTPLETSTTVSSNPQPTPPTVSETDSHFPAQRCFFPIDTSEQIVEQWESRDQGLSLRQSVIETLKRDQNNNWRAVDVLRTGYHDMQANLNEICITITVVEGAECEFWKRLAWMIHQELVKRELDGLVSVLVINGNVGFIHQMGLETEDSKGCHVCVPVGASLCREGGHGESQTGKTGTLGGYVVAKVNGEKKVFGMTCHHVVGQKEAINSQNDKHVVYSPSTKDCNDRITRIQNTIEALEVQKQKAIKEAKSTYEDEDENVSKDRAVNRIVAAIESAKAAIKRKQDFNPVFGKVYASSGLCTGRNSECTQNPQILDWALIECDTDRIGNLPNQFPEDIKPLDNIVVEHHICGTEKLVPGMTVFKFGSRTGLTLGIVNAIDSEINVPVPCPNIKEPVRMKVCLGSNLLAFAGQGDSGAWIVSVLAKVCGVLSLGNDHGYAYASSFELVREDIRNGTGLEISLPDMEE